MAGKSTYLGNKQLEHSMGKNAWAMPTTVALALCTAVPGVGDSGSTIAEAAYTGYARLVVPASSLNSASGGQITNSADLAWPACTGGSSTIVAVAFLDSATIGAGNLLRWGLASFTIIAGVTPDMPAGQLVISES